MTANKKFFLNLIYKSLKNGSARTAVVAVSIMLGACVCAAFINVYLDIDSKVSRELKTYGANMIFAPANLDNDDMSEAKFGEAIGKIPSQNLLGSSGYLFTQANIGPTNAVLMGAKFSELDKVKPFLEVKEGSAVKLDFDDKSAQESR